LLFDKLSRFLRITGVRAEIGDFGGFLPGQLAETGQVATGFLPESLAYAPHISDNRIIVHAVSLPLTLKARKTRPEIMTESGREAV
jgi:hypothetical protein